jgi:hypothetical protein
MKTIRLRDIPVPGMADNVGSKKDFVRGRSIDKIP